MPQKTNSGFVNIIVLVIAALSIVGSLFYVKGELKQRLGAANTELSDTIGTFRTNVNTLNHQIIDSTSTDPGHVHTLTSSSGTLSMAKGGTGTSTLPTTDGQLPIVSASTTQLTYTTALPNCNTTSTDKLLYSSTTKNWFCSTDQNVGATITSTGTLVLVASATMATASSSLDSGTFSPANFRNFRFVFFLGKQSGGTQHFLQFNASSAASQEYGWRLSDDGGAQQTGESASGIIFSGAGASIASSTVVTGDIYDYSLFKTIDFTSISTASSTAKGATPSYLQGGGMWASSTRISSMSAWIGSGANTFPPGSWIKIWGY